MKRSLLVMTATAITALSIGVVAPAQAADAAYGVTVTPTTNLKSGDKITVTMNGLTAGQGVYASVCKQGASATTAPTPCDNSTTNWITTTGDQGSVKLTATITVNAEFDGAKCLTDGCVVYIRGDHMNRTDASLIRTVALGFVGGGVARAKDTATLTMGNVTLQPNQPGELTYRTPVTISVVAASGLPVTLRALSPNCALDGNTLTALTGSGTCAIAATTIGSETIAPLFVNFPFYTNEAKQVIVSKFVTKKLVLGKPVKVAASALSSSLMQDVTLTTTSPKVCTVAATAGGWTVTGKRVGACRLVAGSAASAGKWTAASLKINVAVSKK